MCISHFLLGDQLVCVEIMLDGDRQGPVVCHCRVTSGCPRWPDIRDTASALGMEGVQDREMNCV